ncbi:DUF2187 domain-containing protein [Ligilactobacillus cholophilus]|uniref:DUF2187 domain-containing protein n=1 Tax=Ligilactobacillus cholophilus TaxID=3050131 RepID=UPI0025AEFB7B|nr:DUF2187 domain-containing protein [Ligilactobacillus cholophilus]
MAKKFKVGDKVTCKAFGPLKHNFSGTVEKIYENSALIRFSEFDPKDKIAVSDLHNQAIVRLTSMVMYGEKFKPEKVKKAESKKETKKTSAKKK